MISERRFSGLLAVTLPLVLVACSGGDSGNSSESGIRVHLAETHYTQASAARSTSGTEAPLIVTKGGYAHDSLQHHEIRDKNGIEVSLYRAYVVLDQLELVPCVSLSRLPGLLLDALVAPAAAHAGHGAEPAGGRALNKPNVIDLLTQDEFILPLGDAAVAPGRYCGLRAAVVRLAGDAYGRPTFQAASNDDPISQPEVPDLAGKAFAIRADYCSTRDGTGNCTGRTKADADDVGLTLPTTVSLNFSQPLTLGESSREAFVVLGIAYGGWGSGVDATRLGTDASERQKLLNNIVGSLHINSAGLGALPPNI